MSDATLQAIRDALHEKFRGTRILDNSLGGNRGHSFRFQRGGRLIHHLTVARELLDARRQTALSTIFDRFDIVRVLEEAGAREVSVSSHGVTVQSVPAPAAPAARREPDTASPIVPPTPAPTAAAAAAQPDAPAAAEEPAAPPPTPAPTAAPPAAAVSPPVAPGDSFAAALRLIRELRHSLHGIDDGLGESVRGIDADLAEAEASVLDAEARFQRATAQLTELVAAMDAAVARARAGLDRVQRRDR